MLDDADNSEHFVSPLFFLPLPFSRLTHIKALPCCDRQIPDRFPEHVLVSACIRGHEILLAETTRNHTFR